MSTKKCIKTTMINNFPSDVFGLLEKISIVDNKKVFYPYSSVLQKKNIVFDDSDALVIKPLPEDVKFPSSPKIIDSGQLFSYKIDITIVDQLPQTETEIINWLNKRVICIFHFSNKKIIFGCNEQPLQFFFQDDNYILPTNDNGFSIVLSGNTYSLKVIV